MRRGRLGHGGFFGGQEGAVRWASAPASGAHALEEAGDRRRRTELHDVVEIANVNAELERARGHDDAVLAFLEGAFGVAAFARREGAVGHEGLHAEPANQVSELFGLASGIDEDEALLAGVQRFDDTRGVFRAADVVDGEFGASPCAAGIDVLGAALQLASDILKERVAVRMTTRQRPDTSTYEEYCGG